MGSRYLDVAIGAARESGLMLAARFAAGVQAEAKGRFDLVTDADRAAERIILERLKSEYPSHAVVAEESGQRAGTSSTHRWYVDPRRRHIREIERRRSRPAQTLRRHRELGEQA